MEGLPEAPPAEGEEAEAGLVIVPPRSAAEGVLCRRRRRQISWADEDEEDAAPADEEMEDDTAAASSLAATAAASSPAATEASSPAAREEPKEEPKDEPKEEPKDEPKEEPKEEEMEQTHQPAFAETCLAPARAVWDAAFLAEHGYWWELCGAMSQADGLSLLATPAGAERPAGWQPPVWPPGFSEAGKPWHPGPGWYLLHTIVFRNKAPDWVCEQAARRALEAGVLDARNSRGATALHTAAAAGNAVAAEALLRAGAGGGGEH